MSTGFQQKQAKHTHTHTHQDHPMGHQWTTLHYYPGSPLDTTGWSRHTSPTFNTRAGSSIASMLSRGDRPQPKSLSKSSTRCTSGTTQAVFLDPTATAPTRLLQTITQYHTLTILTVTIHLASSLSASEHGHPSFTGCTTGQKSVSVSVTPSSPEASQVRCAAGAGGEVSPLGALCLVMAR